MEGGGEPQSGGLQWSWRVTVELCIFQGEMARPQGGPIALKLSQNIAKSMAYIIIQSYGDFQQGVACTSQPVAFNGHPSTRGRLTGLRNKPQRKQTCQHLAVVYWQLVSLLIELSIGTSRLCQHNFEHNRSLKALSIMPA